MNIKSGAHLLCGGQNMNVFHAGHMIVMLKHNISVPVVQKTQPSSYLESDWTNLIFYLSKSLPTTLSNNIAQPPFFVQKVENSKLS